MSLNSNDKEKIRKKIVMGMEIKDALIRKQPT